MRRLASIPVLLGLSIALIGAGVASAAPGSGIDISTDTGPALRLSSSVPGAAAGGNSLSCPPLAIVGSSGESLGACEFTISSVGGVAPVSVTVTVAFDGITPAAAAAHKFAIAPRPGRLVYASTAPQAIYTFAGADLPVTVSPGLVWGLGAGAALDAGDLGASFGLTYSVVAEGP